MKLVWFYFFRRALGIIYASKLVFDDKRKYSLEDLRCIL